MNRATLKELYGQANMITRLTGQEHHIDVAYGQPRLVREDGKEISPRLTRSELYRWNDAYIQGLQAMESKYESK